MEREPTRRRRIDHEKHSAPKVKTKRQCSPNQHGGQGPTTGGFAALEEDKGSGNFKNSRSQKFQESKTFKNSRIQELKISRVPFTYF